jgi:hypothetical protein
MMEERFTCIIIFVHFADGFFGHIFVTNSPNICKSDFFWCEIIDGELTPSIETPEVGFFGRDELPPISTARVTEEQIQQFFDYLESVPDVTKFD